MQEAGNWKLEAQEARSWKLETRSARSWKLEDGNWKLKAQEAGNWKLEALENGARKVHYWATVLRGRKFAPIDTLRFFELKIKGYRDGIKEKRQDRDGV